MWNMLATYRLVSKRVKEEAEKVFLDGATITFTTPMIFMVGKDDKTGEELQYKLSFAEISEENNKRMAVFRDDDILKDVEGLYKNGQQFSKVNVGQRHHVEIEGLGPQDALLQAWKRTVGPEYLLSSASNLETVRLRTPKRAVIKLRNVTVQFELGWELKLKEAQCALGNVQLSVPVHEFFSTVIKGHKEGRLNESAQDRTSYRPSWGWWCHHPH